MTYDWHTHPLHIEVSKDGDTHMIWQALKLELIPLGRLKRDPENGNFYFHARQSTSYSDTQLWQIMCHLSQTNLNRDTPGT